MGIPRYLSEVSPWSGRSLPRGRRAARFLRRSRSRRSQYVFYLFCSHFLNLLILDDFDRANKKLQHIENNNNTNVPTSSEIEDTNN